MAQSSVKGGMGVAPSLGAAMVLEGRRERDLTARHES